MAGPIGISFKPSEQQSALGPRQAGKEGLQQAIQLLSFRYPNPRVSGSRSIVGDPNLLGGPSTPTRVGGFNPNAAMLQALIQAFSGSSSLAAGGGAGMSRGSTLPSFTPVDVPGGSSGARLPSPTRVDEDAPDAVTRAYDPQALQGALRRPSYQDQMMQKYGDGY